MLVNTNYWQPATIVLLYPMDRSAFQTTIFDKIKNRGLIYGFSVEQFKRQGTLNSPNAGHVTYSWPHCTYTWPPIYL